MPLTDTHAHLADEAFESDLEEVLSRAQEAGIGAVVAVGESLSDAQRNLELASAFPGRVFPAAGLFPTRLELDEAAAIEAFIREHADILVAVGEIGLDYWKIKEESDRALQREIFGRSVDLAIELDLPVNVHSRSTGRETIGLLLERGATRVQLHAFDGRAATALPAIEAGYFFSVPPSIGRSRQKQKLVRRLPLECLLLETDSPVLGPDPQQRNEPANALLSAQAIAELQERPLEEVLEAVAANTERLYRLSERS